MDELFKIDEKIGHILKVSPSELLIAEIAVINEKALFFKVNQQCFLSFRPNKYESD